MNKLGNMKKCPKCGMEQFSITYVAPLLQERFTAEPLILEDEYMKVKCTRCGYIEKELPLDAEDEKDV